MAIKKGDTVVVITGKEKGKTGKVLEVDRETMQVRIERLNMVKRHQKPRSQTDPGGILEKEASIKTAWMVIAAEIITLALIVLGVYS